MSLMDHYACSSMSFAARKLLLVAVVDVKPLFYMGRIWIPKDHIVDYTPAHWCAGAIDGARFENVL